MAAKEASLAFEPASDDENAVTLLVRMPDGSRRGRRFLKSDKLHVSFAGKVMLKHLASFRHPGFKMLFIVFCSPSLIS